MQYLLAPWQQDHPPVVLGTPNELCGLPVDGGASPSGGGPGHDCHGPPLFTDLQPSDILSETNPDSKG